MGEISRYPVAPVRSCGRQLDDKWCWKEWRALCKVHEQQWQQHESAKGVVCGGVARRV